MNEHGMKYWEEQYHGVKYDSMEGCEEQCHGMKRCRAKYYGMIASTGLFFTALALLLFVSADTSFSYFTTYVSANGGRNVALGESTYLEEDVNPEGNGLRKEVRILNTGETDCYVRVKVFAGSQVNQTEKQTAVSVTGAGWRENTEDGFWYYEEAVPAGNSTQILTVKITPPTEEDREFLEIESFNVIVIQECTQVRYDEDGNAYADWNAAAAIEEGEGA